MSQNKELTVLANTCSKILYGDKTAWKKMKFQDFIDIMAKAADNYDEDQIIPKPKGNYPRPLNDNIYVGKENRDTNQNIYIGYNANSNITGSSNLNLLREAREEIKKLSEETSQLGISSRGLKSKDNPVYTAVTHTTGAPIYTELSNISG